MIFTSPYPPVDIPERCVTEHVLACADEHGDRLALIDGASGRTLTFGGLRDSVRRMAAGLAKRGLAKGEVVAIHSPNLPDYAVLFHAVASIGGINTTINPLATAEDLRYQLQDSEAKYLVTVDALKDTALTAARDSGVEEVLSFDAAAGTTPLDDIMLDAPMPERVIDPYRDLVALPYSSGTTGYPKGVMLTHYNLVANLVQTDGHRELTRLNRDDTLIGALPFYHIYGMVLILNFALMRGARVVTMPRFELEAFLELAQRYRITFAHLVPPVILALAKRPEVDRYDLSALRGILSGAAPLDEGLAHEAGERLGCPVTQGYGLTETSPVTHIGPTLESSRRKPGSVGVCLPSTECKIIDTDTGAELGRGADGELCIRGPQVMRGYLARPEATAATIDEEGWLHTGDIARVDDDDYFYVVDRVKELIKYKGRQVPPAELEAALIGHPAVADAAVIPSPDSEAGEVPKAFVVATDSVSAESLMEYVAERVAPYKRIRRLEFVDEIPKTLSGKILRRKLVERERAAVGS